MGEVVGTCSLVLGSGEPVGFWVVMAYLLLVIDGAGSYCKISNYRVELNG